MSNLGTFNYAFDIVCIDDNGRNRSNAVSNMAVGAGLRVINFCPAGEDGQTKSFLLIVYGSEKQFNTFRQDAKAFCIQTNKRWGDCV